MDCYTSDVHYIQREGKKSEMGEFNAAQVPWRLFMQASIHSPFMLRRLWSAAALKGVFYSTWPALCNQLNAVYVPAAAGRSEFSLPQMGLKRRERAPYLICDTLHLLCEFFCVCITAWESDGIYLQVSKANKSPIRENHTEVYFHLLMDYFIHSVTRIPIIC
jgi:hypothetical protein